MSKKKDDSKKNPAVTPAKNTKTDQKLGAKSKLKIRELTEEEASR